MNGLNYFCFYWSMGIKAFSDVVVVLIYQLLNITFEISNAPMMSLATSLMLILFKFLQVKVFLGGTSFLTSRVEWMKSWLEN